MQRSGVQCYATGVESPCGLISTGKLDRVAASLLFRPFLAGVAAYEGLHNK